jgi:hypothetical protein
LKGALHIPVSPSTQLNSLNSSLVNPQGVFMVMVSIRNVEQNIEMGFPGITLYDDFPPKCTKSVLPFFQGLKIAAKRTNIRNFFGVVLFPKDEATSKKIIH